MSEKNKVLEQVNPSRRAFMQRLLVGGGVAALLALPASELLARDGAQGATGETGKGKGKGKGAKGASGATGGTGKGKGAKGSSGKTSGR